LVFVAPGQSTLSRTGWVGRQSEGSLEKGRKRKKENFNTWSYARHSKHHEEKKTKNKLGGEGKESRRSLDNNVKAAGFRSEREWEKTETQRVMTTGED